MKKNLFLLLLFISSLLLSPGVTSVHASHKVSHSSLYAHFMEGVIEKARGDMEGAEESFKKAYELSPVQIDILKEMVDLSVKKKNFNEARHWAEEILKVDPDDIDAMILLARINVQEKHIKEAVNLLEKVLEKDPHNKRALFYLGNIYMEIKDYAKAIDILERSLKEKTANSFVIHYYLGLLYLDAQKLDKAEIHLKKALEENNQMVDAFKNLGRIYELRKQSEQAVSAYSAYLNRRPTDFQTRDHLISYLIRLGEREKAFKEIEELLKYQDDDPRIGFRASAHLLDIGHYEDALEVLQALESVLPGSPQVIFYKAIAYEGLGKNEEALSQYEKIGPKEPVYLLARLRISRILRDEKRLNDALNSLKEAIEQPNLVHKSQLKDVRLEIALILDEMGKRKEAIQEAQKILKEHPDDPQALNFIGYTYAEMGKKLDEAESMIKRALEKQPEDGFIMDSLGWVFYKKGLIFKSIKTLKRAVELAPNDPVINEHLGDALFKNQEYEEAEAYYRKARRLQKDKDAKKRLSKKIDECVEAQQEFLSF